MVKKVLIIATCFFVFHLVLAASYELIDDEAYYNFWSTSVALGYYDHPPMIAWWIYLGKLIIGSTTLGVRFISVCSFFVVSLLVGRIAFLLSSSNVVVSSVLLFNITMPIMGLGFISTPDAPLLLFWTLALWAAIEGLSSNNPRYWFLVGVFLALSILSKYNALFFILGLLGWCLLTKEGRGKLTSPFIWLGTLLGIILLLPHALWNYNNDWLGLEKQFSRLMNETVGLSYFFEFLISIIIFTTPALFCFAILGLFKTYRHKSLLLWVYMPSLLYFLNHSFTERIQGNWIIIFFPWFAILASVALQNVGIFWRKFTFFSGFFLTSTILILGLNSQYLVFYGDNPFNQMKGWHSIENELVTELQAANWIAVSEYSMIGRLFWLNDNYDKIWAINEPLRYRFRSDFPSTLCTTPGTLIEKDLKKIDNGKLVESIDGSDTYLTRKIGNQKIMSYKLQKFNKVINSPYC